MTGSTLIRAAIAGTLALAVPSLGQEPAVPTPPPSAPTPTPTPTPAPPPAEAASPADLLALKDSEIRMTVPVHIAGNGPYDFIVDTGSERTVVSRELAQDLAMQPGPDATVHSMTEVSRIPTVLLAGLRVGQRSIADIQAPAISRTYLGAAGILGVDTLQSTRVVLDFERRQMTVEPSLRYEGRWPEGTIVVTARNRFGRLMLVDAAVDGERVYVIIDTGAEVTVANNALRRALERRHRLSPAQSISVVSVTGGRFTADYGVAHMIRLGGADIANLPIAFADAHPFRQLELLDRPAILLGMDALRLFSRVSVDFPNRRVKMLLPDSRRDGMALLRPQGGMSMSATR